jgi:hypothetical protein
MKSHKEITEQLIKNGVKNLKQFGYKQVDENNILTDEVYSEFFVSMLENNLGFDKKVDEAINELINNIRK